MMDDVRGACKRLHTPDGTPPTHRSFRAQDHELHLLQALRLLYKNSELCDYTIIAEGQRFPVHRNVLASVSDYFKVMLTGTMLESRQDFVELKGVTAHAVDVLLNFAYTGKLHLSFSETVDILSGACHLQMKPVITLCSDFLISEMTLKNCVDILNMGDMFSIHCVRDQALHYVLCNFDRVFGCAGLAVNISRTSTPSTCSSVPRVVRSDASRSEDSDSRSEVTSSRSEVTDMDTSDCLTDSGAHQGTPVQQFKSKIESQTSSSSLGISLTCMIDREQLSKLQLDHFCSLLMSNLLCVHSELALFHIVAAWIDVERESRVKLARDVMRHVRFALMSPEELVDQVAPCSIMQNDVDCRRYLDEALRYHVLPSRQPAMQSSRTQVRNNKCLVAFGGRYGFNIGYKHNSNKMYALVGNDAIGGLCEEHKFPGTSADNPRPVSLSADNPESTPYTADNPGAVPHPTEHPDTILDPGSGGINETENSLRWINLPQCKNNLLFASVCVVDNFLYVCGGMGKPAHACSTCHRFDPRTGTWTKLASMRTKRQSFPLVAVERKRKLYAFGGGTPGDSRGLEHFPTDRAECYDIDHDKWTAITVLPDKRKSASACELGNVLYISGGRVEQHTVTSMWSYRPSTNTYTQLSDMLNPHAGHAMLADDAGANLYVIDRIDTTLEKYSLSEDVWTTITPANPLTQRLLSGVARPAVSNQSVYFISYIQNEADYQCCSYDLNKLTMTSLPAYPEHVHCVMAVPLAFPRHMLVDSNNNP